MEIDILNKKLKFNSSEDDFENIVYAIFKEANKTGRFIDYLIIDGMIVKKDFLNYLEENLDNIKHVKVVAMSVKESIMTSLLGFNDFVIEQIDCLDLLIQNLTEDISPNALAQIDTLIEGISIISFQFDKIDSSNNLSNLIPDYILWNELAVEIMKLKNLVPDLDYFVTTGDNNKLISIIKDNLAPILLDMKNILYGIIEN
ncbi:MAG: hypothetical protein Q4P31_05920 [Andreesenia angusta]|nr:hypothetical protein [Andreesenia angusta]